MSLEQLHIFSQVCSLGSLTRAAAAMDTVQPALSRQISAMEASLGTKLLHRTGRGVTPTEAGRRLAAHADGILLALESAEADVRDTTTALTGEVQLGVTPMVAQIMTGPLITALRKRYPMVQIVVSEGPSFAVTEWVSKGAVDLAIMYKPPSQFRESTDSEVLLEEPLCLIEAEGESTRERVLFDDVLTENLALPSKTNGMRRRLDTVAADHGGVLSVEIEVDSYATILSMARTGAARTILPRFAVRDELASGVLRAVPIVQPDIAAFLSLYITRARPLRRPARAMIELIQERRRQLETRLTG
jgi:LysR family nitrogen assimilation transcriptional regulator